MSTLRDAIKFNEDNDNVNRISYYKPYKVDGGDPLNVRYCSFAKLLSHVNMLLLRKVIITR